MRDRLEEKLRKKLIEIFNGLAGPTIDSQRKQLGIEGDLTKEDYIKIALRLRELFSTLVSKSVGERVYLELLDALEREEGT